MTLNDRLDVWYTSNNNTQYAVVAHGAIDHAPILIGRATYIHTNIR